MAAEVDAQRPADGRLAETMAGGNSSNATGVDAQQQAASAKATEARTANGVSVTAEDLALREDICYQIFGDVGPLIRDFSCAWDHKVVMHGRMYVTERRLCFYANFFGLEAKMHEDVARCNKGNSAIFIPNAIVVQDKSGKVRQTCRQRISWRSETHRPLLHRCQCPPFAVSGCKRRSQSSYENVFGVEDNRLIGRCDRAPSPDLGRRRAGSWVSQLARPAGDVSCRLRCTARRISSRGDGVPSPPPPPPFWARTTAPSSRRRDGARSASPRLPPPLSTPPPPQRRRGADTGEMGGLSSSLPSSPNAAAAAAASCSHPSSPTAAAARGRSYSMTPASSGSTITARGAAAGGAVLPRPTKLGLAFLGPEHDTPSPPPPPLTPYLMAAVITGAGQAGWGTPESSSSPGRDSPNGRGGGGGPAVDAATAAAEESDWVPAQTDGNDPSRSSPNADGDGARPETGEEATEKQETQGGDRRKVGLVRRSSKLWSMMRRTRRQIGRPWRRPSPRGARITWKWQRPSSTCR
ncbi:unnamed protein product [Scytosiphon promiscuus]